MAVGILIEMGSNPIVGADTAKKSAAVDRNPGNAVGATLMGSSADHLISRRKAGEVTLMGSSAGQLISTRKAGEVDYAEVGFAEVDCN